MASITVTDDNGRSETFTVPSFAFAAGGTPAPVEQPAPVAAAPVSQASEAASVQTAAPVAEEAGASEAGAAEPSEEEAAPVTPLPPSAPAGWPLP